MKTIYGLLWESMQLGDEVLVSTSWVETQEEAYEAYDKLKADKCDPMLFSFEVEDDADEEDVNQIIDDFVCGRFHLVDMGATVLQ